MFIFEMCATKDKMKGVITGLSRCHRDLLRHTNDCILFSNNWCFLWYHNIANTCYSVVVRNLLIRTLLESFETGLSHLKPTTLNVRLLCTAVSTELSSQLKTGYLCVNRLCVNCTIMSIIGLSLELSCTSSNYMNICYISCIV